MRVQTESRRWTMLERPALRLLGGLLLLLTLALGLRDSAQADERITLKVGEVRQFAVAPGAQVVVGNSRVLGYQTRPDGIVVTGKAAGFSTLTVGDRRYALHVFDISELSELAALASRLVSDVEGVEVQTVGGQIILTGTVLRAADITRCQQLAERLGLISLVGFDTTQHFPSPLVQLSFNFAEVNRDELRRMGIAWGNGVLTTVVHGLNIINGFVTLRGSSPGSYNLKDIKAEGGEAAPEDSAINFNESFNWIRVRDQHDVVVLNGETNEYLYGGTLLVPVSSGLASSLEQVEYGIKFKVSPDMDHTGNIRILLEYEVSDLASDPPRGAYKINKREGRTVVLMKEGDTLAVSGVWRAQTGNGASGLPGLIHSPAFEWLFGSHSLQNGRTDGVIFITPTLFRQNASQTRDRIDRVTANQGTPAELPPDTASRPAAPAGSAPSVPPAP